MFWISTRGDIDIDIVIFLLWREREREPKYIFILLKNKRIYSNLKLIIEIDEKG